ncbi:trypsin-like serine protease [Pseudoalteromonas sp. S16_S37]|uniref:trypsin-like serine protease n=1 Tax=Pseudoalteromonas sp. S16_S37 TaxID=2720228 RepID=UPI001680E89B|nr:trypsin-like serine protease [Pseudoalteromonas sp. S16_S37]MBD1583946.1 trypsin-like serine protease [Pseudoalteromonas sp. S16_S37]
MYNNKMTTITLAILSTLASPLLMAKPATSPDVEINIVGGTETDAHSRPYQVALLMNGQQGCGGTLISQDWVLTAAHCVDNASTSSLTVRVGAHSISRNDGQTLRVSQIISHEQWRGAQSIRAGYDIAVLRLASPASSQHTPAKLATADIEQQYASVGDYVTVSGWGLTSNRGRPSDTLREVDLPVISNSSCSSQLNYSIPNSVICGGGQGGRSACNGDSGGPFAVRVGNDFYSIGTVSWGIACQGASAFTRTTSYLDWIKAKTGIGGTDPGDSAPVADFDFTVNQLSVTFTDRSRDDKGVQSHRWNFGDRQGGTSSQANPTYQFSEAGTYNVQLTVTDTKGQTNTTSKQVKVSTGDDNGSCTGVESWSASKSYALNDKVSFNGYEYKAIWWSQGARPDLYPNVWQKGNACGDSSVPVADFSASVNGLNVSFNNSSAGNISSVLWDFGDGNRSSAFSPSHTYAQSGSYQVTLSITDSNNQTATVTKSVSVSGGDTGNCNGVATWSATKIYQQGELAQVEGIVYRANWWVQGENPQASGPWGPWTRVGTCQ